MALAAAVGAASLAFYAATMCPGLTWAYDSADGGELAAAARTLGIPHPPGYPTYVLLAHPFTRLPFGELAARTNAFSALGAAFAVALVTWSVAALTRDRVAAAGAGLALGISPLLWSQAIVTEVHALNALFAALLLALALHCRSRPESAAPRGSWLGWAVGLAWGLSLGNHLIALFLAPLVVSALWRLPGGPLRGAVGTVLGLLVYAYLPLRAAASPAINWGDPRTVGRFWWMVSGGPYRPFVLSLPWRHVPQRLLAWAGLMAQQVAWIGLPVAALGAASLWSRDRPLAQATGTTALLCSLFAVGYDTTDSYLYMLPGLVCLAPWLGEGLRELISAVRPRFTPAARLLVVLLPIVGGVLRLPKMDLRDASVSATFQRQIVAAAPERAVIVSEEDAATFTVWYFQHGLDRRADLVMVDLGLMGYNWHEEQITRQLGAPIPEGLARTGAGGHAEASATLGRPVCIVTAVPEMALSCVEPQ